jgi:hypothetical protein
MKNRNFKRKRNGSLFCLHKWKPYGLAGPDWDIRYGVSLEMQCVKCGRISFFSNKRIEEWPDDLIDPMIRY